MKEMHSKIYLLKCYIGAPYETRTRVSGVRGQRPGPLDEGSMKNGGIIRSHEDETKSCL